MGLDMYLSAKKYISNYDFWPQEKEICGKIKEAMGLTGLDKDDNSVEISLGVAYWRKSNQIHKWFVDNCQDGEDDCGTYYVSREDIKQLRDLCNVVSTTKDAKLLPPQSGFFFGSTDVDEWYWEDIERTSKVLTEILDNPQLQDFAFSYHSSW